MVQSIKLSKDYTKQRSSNVITWKKLTVSGGRLTSRLTEDEIIV